MISQAPSVKQAMPYWLYSFAHYHQKSGNHVDVPNHLILMQIPKIMLYQCCSEKET